MAPAEAVTVSLSVLPGIGGYPDSQRWRDYASNDYAVLWCEGFSYNNAQATLSYCPSDPTNLRGQVYATGLKPNFAYQIKLEGKPVKEWGAAGDDATNERIGYMGRWWRVTPNPGNADDADYEAHKNNPAYIYRGYLLFDYFATDGYGNVNYWFVADNSLHVLWKTSARSPGPYDSAPTSHTLDPQDGYGYYAPDLPPVTVVELYGEWEPTRAHAGELIMTPGSYKCRLILTEEDFHETMNWTSVLGYDYMEFAIGQPAALQLASFLLRPLGGGLGISWRPTFEGDIAGYRLQALRPQGWQELPAAKGLLGADGCLGRRAYEVMDRHPARAYRLEVIGLDGFVKASEMLWAPLDARRLISGPTPRGRSTTKGH